MIIQSTLNRREVIDKAQRLAAILTGQSPDAAGLALAFAVAVGAAALADLRDAFVIKARGGTDVMGIRWPELQESTVAGRRVGPKDRKVDRIKERERIRKREEAKAFKRFILSYDEREARRLARIVAGNRATRETGNKKIEVLGGRDVEILRDSGRLLTSLTPGVVSGSEYSEPEGQIFEVLDGSVTVGSNLIYAGTHNFGDPKRNIPARPFLPENAELIPQAWIDNWADAGMQALLVTAEMYFRGAA